MKKLLMIPALVVVAALAFNYPAVAGNVGHGPAPNSGNGIPDGSGMDGGYEGDDGANRESGRIDTQWSDTGFNVSDSDLIEGITPVVNNLDLFRIVELGVTTDNLAALNNGSFGPAGLSDSNEVVAIHNGAVLTYTLDTTTNPYGYDITNINTYVGWRDGGRDAHNYSISYTTIEDPLTHLALIDYDPVQGCGSWGCRKENGIAASNSALLLSDKSGVLASNVASIQFMFSNVENGYVGYREFDVIGNAAPTPAPEPATMILLGTGLAGLAGFSRKKFKKKK